MNDFMMACVEHSRVGSVLQAAELSRVWSEWRKPSVCPTSCVKALFQAPLLESSVQLAMPRFNSTSASCGVGETPPVRMFVPEGVGMPPEAGVGLEPFPEQG